MYKITAEPIEASAVLLDALEAESAGSVIIHCAVVREVADHTVTLHVSYSPLPGATEELEQIGSDLKRKWHVEHVSLCRRTGRLALGDVISVVGVSAARSKDAFGASQDAVARLKQMKCILKEEAFRPR